MFGIGTGELLLLLLIALLVLGPERMPKLARDVGKAMADLRKTSDELRTEFLNADRTLNAERVLDVATRQVERSVPAIGQAPEMSATSGASEPQAETASGEPMTPERVPPDVGATQAEAVTAPVPAEPEETAFDREARLARERLEDPDRARERSERAAAEGWKIPADDAGTVDRSG